MYTIYTVVGAFEEYGFYSISNSYNTSRRAASDLRSPIPRARSAQGGADCKSDTAVLPD